MPRQKPRKKSAGVASAAAVPASARMVIDWRLTRSQIDKVVGHAALGGVLQAQMAGRGDATVTFRFSSCGENPFFFWKRCAQGETFPEGHPAGHGVPVLGNIHGDAGDRFVSLVTPVVRSVSHLSRSLSGGHDDLWDSVVKPDGYVRGVAVSVEVDAKRILQAAGVEELIVFFQAALYLRDAHYISISGVW